VTAGAIATALFLITLGDNCLQPGLPRELMGLGQTK